VKHFGIASRFDIENRQDGQKSFKLAVIFSVSATPHSPRHAAQIFSGVAGMSRCAAPGTGVGDRVHDGGERPGGAGFADALDAERVGGGRHALLGGHERRNVGGARHRVIHERAGDELAGAVIDEMLQQDLTDALHDRAMHLAFDDHVIQHVAAVVNRRVGDERGRAGVRIDLDFRDMATVRKGLRRVGGEAWCRGPPRCRRAACDVARVLRDR